MHVERHIFGSRQGYQTLAHTPGVSDADCRQLEEAAFAFGQVSDDAFLQSLATKPAYFTMSLSGGRRSLTRVLRGRMDESGRPTVSLVSAVVSSSDWDGRLWGNISALLAEARLWETNGGLALAPLDIQPPPAPRVLARASVPRILRLLSETESAMAAARSICVSEQDFTGPDLVALEVLIPPAARRSFSSGFRILNSAMPLAVKCLALEAPRDGPVLRPGQKTALTDYARMLEPVLLRGEIPLNEIASYREFGQCPHRARAMCTADADPEPAQRRSAVVLSLRAAITFALVLGLAIVGAFVLGNAVGHAPPSDKLIDLNRRSREGSETLKTVHEILQSCENARKEWDLRGGSDGKEQEHARNADASLRKAEGMIAGLPEQLKTAEIDLRPLRDGLRAHVHRVREQYKTAVRPPVPVSAPAVTKPGKGKGEKP